MKNKKFRVISLVLVLVLALQFALVASAASDPNNGVYEFGSGVATVTKNSGEAVLRTQRVFGTQKIHSTGYTTYYSAGYYTISYTTPTVSGSDYFGYLKDAAAEIGVTFEYELYAYTNGFVIPADEPSGTYYLVTDFYGYSGTYQVETWFSGVLELTDGGTYAMAPYGCRGIYGYYRFSD